MQGSFIVTNILWPAQVFIGVIVSSENYLFLSKLFFKCTLMYANIGTHISTCVRKCMSVC